MSDCKFDPNAEQNIGCGIYLILFFIIWLLCVFPNGCTFRDVDNEDILKKLEAMEARLSEVQHKD